MNIYHLVIRLLLLWESDNYKAPIMTPFAHLHNGPTLTFHHGKEAIQIIAEGASEWVNFGPRL